MHQSIFPLFLQTIYYPTHAGFPLGEAESPKYIVVETHYDNPLENSGLFYVW